MVTKKTSRAARKPLVPTAVPIFAKALDAWLQSNPRDGIERLSNSGISGTLLTTLTSSSVKDTQILMCRAKLTSITGLSIPNLFFLEAYGLAKSKPSDLKTYDGLLSKIQELVARYGTSYITTNCNLTRFRKDELEKWSNRTSTPVVGTIKMLIELVAADERGETITDKSKFVYTKSSKPPKRVERKKPTVPTEVKQASPQNTEVDKDQLIGRLVRYFLSNSNSALGLLLAAIAENPEALKNIPDGDLDRVAVLLKKIADAFGLDAKRLKKLRDARNDTELGSDLLEVLGAMR